MQVKNEELGCWECTHNGKTVHVVLDCDERRTVYRIQDDEQDVGVRADLDMALEAAEAYLNSDGTYRVWLINFGWFLDKTFHTIQEAKDYAVSKGFEASIYNAKQMVASWSPIGGYREFN